MTGSGAAAVAVAEGRVRLVLSRGTHVAMLQIETRSADVAVRTDRSPSAGEASPSVAISSASSALLAAGVSPT